jgi:drug/metabolite transporter (DMT)-like permease
VLVFGGAIGLLFLGQQHTTAAVAAVGMCLGPVLTALLAGLLVPGERLSRRGAAGVVLGLAGAVLVARSGAVGVGPVTGVGAGFGAVLVVSAAASGSLGGVLLARLRATAPLTTQAGWGAALGGLVLHAASLWAGEPAGGVVWTPALVGVLLYLSVVVGGVGYVTLLALIRTVGPTRTSFASYASPLVTVLVGLVVLGEPVTSGVVTGFLSILAGFLLVNGVGPGAPDTAGQG